MVRRSFDYAFSRLCYHPPNDGQYASTILSRILFPDQQLIQLRNEILPNIYPNIDNREEERRNEWLREKEENRLKRRQTNTQTNTQNPFAEEEEGEISFSERFRRLNEASRKGRINRRNEQDFRRAGVEMPRANEPTPPPAYQYPAAPPPPQYPLMDYRSLGLGSPAENIGMGGLGMGLAMGLGGPLMGGLVGGMASLLSGAGMGGMGFSGLPGVANPGAPPTYGAYMPQVLTTPPNYTREVIDTTRGGGGPMRRGNANNNNTTNTGVDNADGRSSWEREFYGRGGRFR